MHVESTHVHTALVMPQFDEDSDESSSSDSGAESLLPQYHRHVPATHKSPLRSQQQDDNNNLSDNGRTSSPVPFQGEFQWDNVHNVQQLTNSNAQLVAQMTECKRQIKTLQIQLEAMTPVPGFNADAVQEILLERDGGADHDIRDAKIVHQAKTLRRLKRTLQREKQIVVNAIKQCKVLETAKQQLEKQVDTLTLKAARFQARANAAKQQNDHLQGGQAGPQQEDDADTGDPVSTPVQATAADLGIKKKFDDLKVKHDKLQHDVKKLQRALQREVGDDVALDEFLIENADANARRRGRAQQIVILKAKVKKLEAELVAVKTVTATNGEDLFQPAIMETNVDRRAQQELASQHVQRQKQLDKVAQERDELLARVAQLTQKHDGVKSRAQILEKEKLESKAKFQVLVDKSKNDDALIDALQRQLETWKGKVQHVKRVRTAESASSNSITMDERLELEQLRQRVADHQKRQHGGASANSASDQIPRRPPSASSSSTLSLVTGMPVPSEASQYRTMATEKERLSETVKALQAQLESKERQLRQPKQQQPPMPSMLPSDIPGATRIPQKIAIPTPSSTRPYAGGSDATSKQTAEIEVLRRTFRETIKTKEDQIAALRIRLQDLEASQHQQSTRRDADNDLVLEVQDLQEENQFLRQEFDKLKSRYESLVSKSATNKAK
uniref:Uncharacterized protein n=1 Tax=Globisporangium ultimum (strain ATCC 200006 / CBS 805.95 / DAOM BR144) TaxID=431595 RepID=K3WAH7_GLOUD